LRERVRVLEQLQAVENTMSLRTSRRSVDRAPVSLRCASCDGQGQYQIGRTAGERETLACPVCRARGTQKVTLPAGLGLCTACAGWGLQGYSEDQLNSQFSRIRAKVCPPCRGTGFH